MGVLLVASFAGIHTPSEVWNSWRGQGGSGAFETWLDTRIDPLLYSAVVGAALALTGTIFQAVLRNPLAEPYILGISGAASLGALIARIILPTAWVAALGGASLIGVFAFLGALLALLLLLGLARWARLYDPPSLILAGAVLNAIFGAAILLTYSVAPREKVMSNLFWTMGTIAPETTVFGLGGYAVLATTTALGLVAAVCWGASRSFDLLSLGEEEAADLGVAPRSFRVLALTLASLLTGVVVAAAGPIGFVGLVTPHIARRLHGPAHRRLIPLSLVGGAIFLMLAYTLMRVIPGYLLPLGAVTALVGGPFFLFLLVRRQEVTL